MSEEQDSWPSIYVGSNNPDLLNDSKIWKKINPSTLRQNLNDFVGALHGTIPDVESEQTGYSLKEFEVSVTIGAKGEVGFLGTGAEASGEASLKLTFSKS